QHPWGQVDVGEGHQRRQHRDAGADDEGEEPEQPDEVTVGAEVDITPVQEGGDEQQRPSRDHHDRARLDLVVHAVPLLMSRVCGFKLIIRTLQGANYLFAEDSPDGWSTLVPGEGPALACCYRRPPCG